jgi:hypothetical protein
MLSIGNNEVRVDLCWFEIQGLKYQQGLDAISCLRVNLRPYGREEDMTALWEYLAEKLPNVSRVKFTFCERDLPLPKPNDETHAYDMAGPALLLERFRSQLVYLSVEAFGECELPSMNFFTHFVPAVQRLDALQAFNLVENRVYLLPLPPDKLKGFLQAISSLETISRGRICCRVGLRMPIVSKALEALTVLSSPVDATCFAEMLERRPNNLSQIHLGDVRLTFMSADIEYQKNLCERIGRGLGTLPHLKDLSSTQILVHDRCIPFLLRRFAENLSPDSVLEKLHIRGYNLHSISFENALLSVLPFLPVLPKLTSLWIGCDFELSSDTLEALAMLLPRQWQSFAITMFGTVSHNSSNSIAKALASRHCKVDHLCIYAGLIDGWQSIVLTLARPTNFCQLGNTTYRNVEHHEFTSNKSDIFHNTIDVATDWVVATDATKDTIANEGDQCHIVSLSLWTIATTTRQLPPGLTWQQGEFSLAASNQSSSIKERKIVSNSLLRSVLRL